MTAEVPLGALPDPAAVVDADGVVRATNEGATDLLGVRAGERLADVLGVETIDAADGARVWPDDRPIDVSVSSAGEGQRLVVLRDASGRRERERAEGMLEGLLGHIPLSVYFKDRQGRHVRVSDAICDPVPVNAEGKRHPAPDDVIGKTDFDLHQGEHAAAAVEDDQRVLETGEPLRNAEERVVFPDGTTRYFDTSKAPWYGPDGEIQGVVGVTAEVTAARTYERELERQNERLEEFAGVVSHDLRSPLEVASGRLELYRETGDSEHLETVAEMHERMERLLEETLELARSGERVTEPESVRVADAAERAWSAIASEGAHLSVEHDDDLAADPDRLVELFENLFRNAVEHGSTSPDSQARQDAVEHGGPDVSITVGRLEDDPGFFVADDGCGIPPEEREAVFERGHTTSDDGTGFGLSIVAEIADAHGWTVSIAESEAGGARFEIAASSGD
ncbi:MAG: PAS domain-containing protein [Haloarculaceae archaeon]